SFSASSFDDDSWKLRRVVLGCQRQARGHTARDVTVTLREFALGLGDDRRVTTVGLLADPDVERQRAEERHLILRGEPLTAACAEQVFLVPAVRTHVRAHVFDHAEY